MLWQPTLRAKEAAEKTAADLLKNNKKHLESAKKLRAERGVLLDEIATLTGKLHAATFELEGLARTERNTARMRAGAEKGLLGAVEKAEEKVEDAECMAVLRVAEAERMVEAAARREQAVKERVKAALAEAQAARADAVSEKEAALESAKQLDAAVYNSMLLARQVERAKDKASKLQAKLKELAPVAAGRTTEDKSPSRSGSKPARMGSSPSAPSTS